MPFEIPMYSKRVLQICAERHDGCRAYPASDGRGDD
jgi:hypothetical protein